MSELGGLTWPEVPHDALLVVPIGSCEQHGPHLPFDTDTRVAVALAGSLAERASDVVVAPAVTIGASGEHRSFPGTLSIGTDALVDVLVELCRSALPPADDPGPRPFSAVVVVNGHGGNLEATTRADRLLSDEGRPVLFWHPRVPDGDPHAGRSETSMLLHLHPEVVRTDRLRPGSSARWREIRDRVESGGLAQVSPSGVLGDPTAASAAEGERILSALVEDLLDTVRTWRANLSDVADPEDASAPDSRVRP